MQTEFTATIPDEARAEFSQAVTNATTALTSTSTRQFVDERP